MSTLPCYFEAFEDATIFLGRANDFPKLEPSPAPYVARDAARAWLSAEPDGTIGRQLDDWAMNPQN
jgi:hypothetical protein